MFELGMQVSSMSGLSCIHHAWTCGVSASSVQLCDGRFPAVAII